MTLGLRALFTATMCTSCLVRFGVIVEVREA